MTTYSILLAVLALSAAPQFEARPLKGPVVAGAIVDLDGKRVTLETAAGRVSLETAALLDISAKPKPAAARRRRRPGSICSTARRSAALQYTTQKGRARITLAGGEAVELPADAVAAVRFQPAAGGSRPGVGPAAKLKGGRRPAGGEQDGVLDYHQGTVRDVTDKTVEFEMDGDVVPVKRPNVFGLIYQHPAEQEPSEPLGWITDADGSHWAVRTMSLAGQAGVDHRRAARA